MGRLYKRGDRWGVDYRDHRGKRVRKVIASDKSVAQKVLADAVQASEKLKYGMLATDPREAEKPLATHFDAYLTDMARRGRAKMYRYTVRKHLFTMAEECDWTCLRDCTPPSISKYLGVLADQGLTPKTVNAHRADIAAFLNWCKKQGYLELNPCERVLKSAVKVEKKRRALSVLECRALLEATPPERRVVYLFLIYTGLRRGEAAGLCWHHVRLDVMNPFVEVPATLAKSGQRETVPLTSEVASALREQRGNARPGDRVFDSIPDMPTFREDLAVAQIEEIDSRGRVVVLHSLRHSLATMLAAANVPMAVAQRIMRHRDIRLTAEVYCDEGLLPLTAAIASLPTMGVATASDAHSEERAAQAS